MKAEFGIGRKIAILFLACLCFSAKAQNITSFEYFIDTDPGIGLATTVNPPASPTVTDFNIPISLTSLSSGFHTLYVRGRGTANEWTSTHFRNFYVVPLVIPLPTDIIQMEYFMDIDPGLGVATQVTGLTPSSTITNLPIAIDVTSLTTGFHTLYVRSKNNAGEWTHTHFRNFYIANISTADNLVKFEYFFDTDPGFDNGIPTPVTPTAPSVTNFDIFAIPSGLSIGTHTIYVRGKDSSGDWTQVITGSFVVTAPLPPTITSFSPESGPIGTTVIITGTNFSAIPANNEVRFNGVLTNVTLSSSTSITTSVPSGASTGKITVIVSGNTATSASDFTVTTATIAFNTQPSPQILCEGNNATLSLLATGDTNLQYQWQIDNTGFTNLNNNLLYSGVNTSVLNITNPSISLNGSVFRCLVYGDNSVSTASESATLTINAIPLAEITANGIQLTASSGDSYQWYHNDNPVSGATSQSFEYNVLEYGVYVVDVTENGCTSTSSDFVYLITGLENPQNDLKIYPNPVEENLFVEFNPPYKIQVVGVSGVVIQNFNAPSKFSSLDFSSMAKGIYLLKVQYENQTQYIRIIKR